MWKKSRYFTKNARVKRWWNWHLHKDGFQVQADLVICGLFICDFAYMQSRIGLFAGTYPQITSHPWSLYMRIRYMRVYFWSPYLSHITRSTCIMTFLLFHIRKKIQKDCVKKLPSFMNIQLRARRGGINKYSVRDFPSCTKLLDTIDYIWYSLRDKGSISPTLHTQILLQ